jgi:hypothetical protein
VGLLPVSDSDPTQFGNLALGRTAGAPTAAHSLPSMMMFDAPHRRKRPAENATTYTFFSNPADRAQSTVRLTVSAGSV